MCRETVMGHGFEECPTWQEVFDGRRPEDAVEPEVGEWAHGWQYHAASRIEKNHREVVVLPNMTPSARALLRSQSGPGSAAHLVQIPCRPEFKVDAPQPRAMILRRLRLPLGLADARCNGRTCNMHLDELGDHRAACPRSGRLKRRSVPLERALARVCREAGARVRVNVLVRDLNVPGVLATDGRRIEVIADGLPIYGGGQIALDATIVSPLTRTGLPRCGSDDQDGGALAAAQRKKEEHTYRDIVQSRRCRFITCGMEVGGRWSPDFLTFLTRLAKAKARAAPRRLQTAAKHWWKQRWMGMLALASQASLSASLIDEVMNMPPCSDGHAPLLSQLLE